jgi:hypothetical protein
MMSALVSTYLLLGGALRVSVAEFERMAAASARAQVENVRAVYLTSGITRSSRFDRFLDLIEETEVNALVIDLKDPDGRLSFRPVTDALRPFTPDRYTIKDLPRRVERIHERGGLAIARIAVFADNWYAERHPSEALKFSSGALWRDGLGGAWLDAASRDTWQYAADLGHEAAALGFDEVNYDYIRFPSDGALRQIVYPHWDKTTPRVRVIQEFAQFIDAEVRQKGIRTSADVFGLSYFAADGMGIGQQLEYIAPYFDVLAPMVYPSHYASGFRGYENPADYPYEVIRATLDAGIPRILRSVVDESDAAVTRPWLQDFDIGAIYDAPMLRKQIAAAEDSGGSGWMMWNPIGNYSTDAF